MNLISVSSSASWSLGLIDQGDRAGYVSDRRMVFLAGRYKIGGQETGSPRGAAMEASCVPTGLLPIVLVTSGVVFAYAAIELVGTSYGETAEPAKIMPRAINSVVLRIACFYVGSICWPCASHTAYKEHKSARSNLLSKIGNRGGQRDELRRAHCAALSSLNAGLWLHRRILRS